MSVDWSDARQLLEKPVSETRRFNINFSALLVSGETIATITSCVSTKDEAVVGVSVDAAENVVLSGVVASGQVLQIEVSGGTQGVQYLITAVVTGTLGSIVGAECYLFVPLAIPESITVPIPPVPGGAGVTSFEGRTGAVVSRYGDYTAAEVGADAVGTAALELATHTAAADPHTMYMQELIYDPAGYAVNVYDGANLIGVIDCGVFT